MKIFVFGEVLFDVYLDSAIIGGAPFNFCAHLSKLGNNTALLSAVGEDRLGKLAVQQAEYYGIDLSKLQTNILPTGVCHVTMDATANPSYDLAVSQAYDRITLPEMQMKEIEMTDDRILYFGTLALRGKESALTLKKLLKLSGWKEILFDVNFRQNFYSAETVRLGLQHCTILKFSREEADILIKLGLAFSKFSLLTLCKELSRHYPNIHTILLTLDKEGATVYQADTGKFTPSPALKCEVVSPVGAGDSFFAGYLHSMLRGRDTVSCLNNAITLSSYVVGHLEAVPKYTKELLAQLK